jgi:hypothetical protein
MSIKYTYEHFPLKELKIYKKIFIWINKYATWQPCQQHNWPHGNVLKTLMWTTDVCKTKSLEAINKIFNTCFGSKVFKVTAQTTQI